LGPIIGTHLLDLAAAALGPTADAKEIIATRGVKAARLHTILAKIAQRFKDPTLNVDNTAAMLGLSRRYVQELLEQTGKSFTEHLTERRLECAYAMLSDGRYRQSRIIDIAYEAGFSDASHFYRMFRRRYGGSPSDVRAAATGKAQE
jgi:AraC-like DNA-binding protein